MNRNAKPFLILLIAVALVLCLSFFGWEELTGGLFKSYDMFADIRGDDAKKEAVHQGNEYIDPDLKLLMEELDDNEKYEYIDEKNTLTDETSEPAPEFSESEENLTDEDSGVEPETTDEQQSGYESSGSGTVEKGTPEITGIEDYSQGNANTRKLKAMFGSASDKVKRIAVLGDSYIEGDIFTEGVRESLQDKYGGSGVGYTPVYSEFPGFRRSVLHSCSGFETLDFRHSSGKKYALLQGVSARADSVPSFTFTGTSKRKHAEGWDNALLLLTAPYGGNLRIRLGKDKKGEWQTYHLEASRDLQAIEIPAETERISVASITPGIVFQGLYLDGKKGIAVDNMSIRGYAGIRHDEISEELIQESKPYVDYGLIVLEYGINALTSTQKNYGAYEKKMVSVVNHLKKLYPEAVIMIMGIGDRGEKTGGEFHSMSTVENMIESQRNLARTTGSLFWDTRRAMGGEDAVVEWVKDKDINKDYIHLSFKGGDRLANLFVRDLENLIE